MTDIMNLLPIGTVLRLTGATKNLMIIGVCQTNEDDGKLYDYLGVLWPEGNIGPEGQVLFMHQDIETVIAAGYANEETTDFLTRLNAYYEQNT